MTHNKPTLTVDERLAIAEEQLARWKTVLKPEVYFWLENRVNTINTHRDLRNGYDVFRGVEIASLLLNEYEAPPSCSP